MQTLRSGITFTVSVALMLVSCSEEDVKTSPDAISGRQICFDTGAMPVSRGKTESVPPDTFCLVAECTDIPVLHCTGETEPMGVSAPSRASDATLSDIEQSGFGVIAHASWYEPLLMDNDLYKCNASGIYQSQNVRYWIDDPDAEVGFYAFFPHNTKGLTLPGDKASTDLSYTVPAAASEQTDILLAVSKGIVSDYIGADNQYQPVPLTFRHLLAGVRVRFVDIPDGWKIRSVSFSGLHLSGTLDFAADNPRWAYTDQAEGMISTDNPSAETLFTVLPTVTASQTSQEVTLTVVVDDGTPGGRSYSSRLTAVWTMGNKTTYTININNYQFSIENTADIDAHYVILTTDIKAEGVRADKNWTVTCETSGEPSDVSIQLQSEMNEYSRLGFWTDKLYEESTNSEPKGSARGAKTLELTGSGSFPVAIFVPENTGEVTRDIRLTVKIDGKTEKELLIRQLCPAWAGSGDERIGWEQIDDDVMAQYGFKWNRVACYMYVYSFISETSSKAQRYKDYCQSVINENFASKYASVEKLTFKPLSYRWYIKIDYSKLNSLSGIAQSASDGRSNTISLFKNAGSAITGSFERVLGSILKTEKGQENQTAFRIGNGQINSDGGQEAPAPTGKDINGSPAVGNCLKKNRYNLLQTTAKVDGTEVISLSPFIKEEDIFWYLPAVDQFSTLPSAVASSIVPGDYWSSTAVTDGENAYLGNRSTGFRLDEHKVRAVRKKI